MRKAQTPSGFTENLPSEQIVENDLKLAISETAELYGFTPLETPAVEYLDTLASKGEINKEIYTISRALAEEGEQSNKQERALRFDLTVPLARYVAQHYSDLVFPFKRYQIQKVWRGERPQKGRAREFYQADLDIVANEKLPIHFDAELPLVMGEILSSFELGKGITIHINNRKFLNGLFREKGITNTEEAMRIVDKLDKIGVSGVRDQLVGASGIEKSSLDTFLEKLETSYTLEEAIAWLGQFDTDDTECQEGIDELLSVLTLLKEADKPDQVTYVFSPRIARGLDYYTGTVYETTIDGFERYGSICSGGRYANLTQNFTHKKLPGNGMSIGLTRLFDIIRTEKLIEFDDVGITDLLIGFASEDVRPAANDLASDLREAGVATETIYDAKLAIGKQRAYGEKKNIPLFIEMKEDETLSLTVDGETFEVTDVDELLEKLT